MKDRNEIFLKLIGHLGMLGLCVLAGVLWLERSTTFDSSLYSYMIIWREGFYTPHDRNINMLWQWIPILAVKYGVSLSAFLKIMSLSPIIFLYSVFLIIVHGLKNSLCGVYLVLCCLLYTSPSPRDRG